MAAAFRRLFHKTPGIGYLLLLFSDLEIQLALLKKILL